LRARFKGVMHIKEEHELFKIIRISILFSMLMLIACDADVNINARSGSIENDYIEEPLIKLVSRFENALITSNSFVEGVKSNNIDSLYQNLFSKKLRSKVSQEEFKSLITELKATRGEIVQYKKMQWSFIKINGEGDLEGKKLIASVKIVKHEKVTMKYLIAFEDDGKFNEIVLINFKKQTSVFPAGQF